MKNNTERTSVSWTTLVQQPWMQGPLLGSTVMMLVTPLLKWTNHVYNNEKMSFRKPFSGAGAYAVSAVPGYATTFACKAILKKTPEETSQRYDLFTSFVAGGFSGLVCTPFEAIAQNIQLTSSASTLATVKQMHAHHGPSVFFQGGASIVAREGVWSTVYLTAIPMLAKALQEKGMKKQSAEFVSVLTVAGTFGLFSAPLNQLRFKKQYGLTESITKKSYVKHAKDIYNQAVNATQSKRVGFFFKAAVPRAVTTTVAAGLLVKGAECYEQAVASLSK